MTKSKTLREKLKKNYEMKLGKRCEMCGSEFELQLHHDKDPHLPRRDPQKDDHVIVLCATCHELEDSYKMLSCYPKTMLRKYEQQCQELENHFKKLGVDK